MSWLKIISQIMFSSVTMVVLGSSILAWRVLVVKISGCRQPLWSTPSCGRWVEFH